MRRIPWDDRNDSWARAVYLDLNASAPPIAKTGASGPLEKNHDQGSRSVQNKISPICPGHYSLLNASITSPGFSLSYVLKRMAR